jgi:hypothetical protein
MAFLVETGDELPERLPELDVDPAVSSSSTITRAVHRRLRHQHRRFMPPELAHVGVGLVGQAQVGEQLVDPGIVAVHAVAALDAQRLADAEERVEYQLLRNVPSWRRAAA